ncbi:acyl-CoA thioesterase [Solimonas terrae]|uniref:Acyl-CoA thioesterase n=1 Tax=Solimonas terrae TaxID=1396819 RepID=A0A6M2BM94_9GAMM|nr:thioesterase family protein [Solimonas terrae]NGY03514.1 acyl-CoA thioesterase [Solimonas terrae]
MNDSIATDAVWDVPKPFVELATIAAGDVDRFGHTNNVVYLSLLERVAWSHSESLGLDFAAYEKLGAGCVARRHELDYLAPTFAGEQLWLATWVHDNDFRLSMWRRYQIVRAADRKTVLRGQTQWVCVDMKSGRPKRMPAEFQAYKPWPRREGDAS